MRTTLLVTAVAGIVLGCAHSSALPWIEQPLSPGRSYIWDVRAYHSGNLWVPANDSLDVVLLRVLCQPPRPGDHGMGGCSHNEDSSLTVRWDVPDSRGASVVPLARGAWIFGSGSAGARVYGHAPGRVLLLVRLPQGVIVDTVLVLPAFDRVRIEPRDTVITVGDTTWIRVSGLRNDGTHIALPWPLWGTQVGPPRADGAIPIVFEHAHQPSVPTAYATIVYGSKRDSVLHRYVKR